MAMKQLQLSIIGICICTLLYPLQAQNPLRARSEINLPNLPGYLTLKCDFHSHTVFSDGLVWPTIRVEEAWREGLDAIAITDHIEYLPHTNDMIIRHGRSYQLVTNLAASLDILVIPGAEITRGEPPGHWNALFVTNINALVQTNYYDAVSNAYLQGAFIFWNHPGWKQPDNKSVWYKEQDRVYKLGYLAGIEIVNGDDYDPIAHRWCIEKNLTVIGNTDIHNPVMMDYEVSNGKHRPMTLVFAKERTLSSIREALFERRTAVWLNNNIYGDASLLKPLFERSIQIITPNPVMRPKGRILVHIKNSSAVTYELQLRQQPKEITLPKKVILVAGKTMLLEIRNGTNSYSGAVELSLPYKAMNLFTAPEQVLPVDLKLTVTFTK